MNVTRDVMKDLLPLYFSGEASADTRALVEEYFRENPEFERTARSAAKPMESLRATVAVAPEAEREKRDLERVHRQLWRKRMLFGMAVFLTLAPLAFIYRNGHVVWMMMRNEPWSAAFYWLLAAVVWVLYLTRPRRRTASLLLAAFLAIAPVFIMHGSWSAQSHAKDYQNSLWLSIFAWCMAALSLVHFFVRTRRRTEALTFALFVTAFPVLSSLYSLLSGTVNILGHALGIFGAVAGVMWAQYFWLRRKANVDEEEC
jgi:anti-sigma factor RsiW